MSADPATDEVPLDLEAEERVLGSMLLTRQAVLDVADVLRPRDFYRGSHRYVYQAIVDLDNMDKPTDAVSVRDRLEENGNLTKAGGPARLAELAALVPAASNVRHYANIVRDASVRRDLRDAGYQMQQMAAKRGAPAADLVSQAETLVLQLSTATVDGDLEHVSQSLGGTIQRMQRPAGDLTGVPLGLTEVDRLTTGFHPGNLVIVGARPSMGKSALILGMIDSVAVDRGLPVGVFSLEMTKDELNQRLISRRAFVDLQRMRRGTLDEPEWSRIIEQSARIDKAPLYIDDAPAIRLADIRSRARRLKLRTPNLAAIIVDYLQLIAGDGKAENRNLEVQAISQGLKAIARELQVPVVALSQLSRQVDGRPDKRPLLSDLRDSGSIEQDADVVLFIYRDERYYPDTPKQGIAEINVAKQRNGPTDVVEVAWRKAFARFGDLSH